jgi:hypothetical protein
VNVTNWEHAFYAMCIQLLLWAFIGPWCAGLLAVSVFAAREYAQVEYKIRAATGLTLTELQPWHVLRKQWWSKDAILDIVIPAICVFALAGVGSLI